MKEQDDDFNKQRQEYEREIKHLRLLLRERQEVIDSVLGDKRWVLSDAVLLSSGEYYCPDVKELPNHSFLPKH